MKFPIVSVSEATQQGSWFVFGLGTQLVEKERYKMHIQFIGFRSKACTGWTATARLSTQSLSSVQSAWRRSGWRRQTSSNHSCHMMPGSTSRSFRTQLRSMMVKHSVTHEPNTFHQQSHNANSICIRSANSFSAACNTSLSEARHVRTRIRPGLIHETTHGWAWTTSSSVVARVTQRQNDAQCARR